MAWQVKGMGLAWERYAMCESALTLWGAVLFIPSKWFHIEDFEFKIIYLFSEDDNIFPNSWKLLSDDIWSLNGSECCYMSPVSELQNYSLLACWGRPTWSPKIQSYKECCRLKLGKNVPANTGLFISPSGISELDCATTKTDTAERSISIGRESLQVFLY